MHIGPDFLHLSDASLEALDIAPPAIADAIEAALRDKAAGRLFTAPKTAIIPGGARYMMSTLAVGSDPALTVVKTATVSPENPARNLPSINGGIQVYDAETGLLRAVMGANWITAVRTAALSVVAARRLADPQSRSVAFIGCGVQASSHLAAFASEFPLREVRAFGRGTANRKRLMDEARTMGLAPHAPETAQQALEGADIVVTSVTLDYSIDPFLDAAWLKPTAFATITDAGIPWHQSSLANIAPLVIDDSQQEAQSAVPMVPAEAVTHDLTELVAGPKPVRHPDRPAAFAFRGLAIGDFAAAALALQRAEERGAGQVING